MILKLKWTIFMVFLGLIAIAQDNSISTSKQELTLEDAILKRFSDLYPEGISGLNWYGDQLIKFSDDKKSVITYALGKEKQETIISLSDINNALDKEWKGLPRLIWGEGSIVTFQKDNNYYSYDIKTKKAQQILSYPKEAQNISFCKKSKILVYTIKNNLYISYAKNDKIAITNHSDPNIVAGQAIARYEMGITKGIFWAPTGKLIAFYQKDETEVTDYPLVDITTTPATLSNTKYPMAGQGSEYAQIGIYNPALKKLIYLDTDGKERDQYLTNLTWGPNAKYIYVAIVNRGQDHVWLNKYDATTGKLVKTLFEETDKRYVEPENDLYFIPGKDNEFLWFSERDGYNHLYRYNTNGKLLNQVTKGNWAVLNILGIDKKSGKLIISGTDESGINQVAYKTKLTNSKSKRLNEANGIHRYKLNASGSMMIDDYSTLDQPRIIDLISTKGNKKINLKKSKNPLDSYKLGTVELVQFKSKQGINFHGRIIKPSDFDPKKKYPVFVYLYGGPHAQMVTNRWMGAAPLWMLHMAERGYIIWTMDNRGSANRGNKFESVVHRQLGTLEMQDQLSGVEYLETLPYADTDNMAIHGWSFGGFMATTMMLRAPGVFDVGVAGGPVTDWKYYEVMYGERYMDSPQDNPEGYEKAQLRNYVENLEGDLLLIHGSIDPTVVPQHSLDLIKAFVDKGIQMDFYTYPMHPHNVRGKDRVHLMSKVLDYVDNKLLLKSFREFSNEFEGMERDKRKK